MVNLTASPVGSDVKATCCTWGEQRCVDSSQIRETKPTNVISWALVKRRGLNLLQERVGPFVAIQHEPYFGPVAVHYDGHLELAERRFRRWQFAGNVGEPPYL